MLLKYFFLTLITLKIFEYIIIIHREKIYRYFFYNLPSIIYNKTNLKKVCQNIFFNNQLIFKHNFEKLKDIKSNTIFVVNYPITKIEYLVCNIFPVNMCLVSSDQANNFLKLVYSESEYITFPSSKKRNNFKFIQKKVLETLKSRNVYVYIENIDGKAGGEKIGKSRIGSGKFSVGFLRTGMFHISKNKNVSITPIAVDYIHINDDYTIPKQNFEIIIGDTFIVNSDECNDKCINTYIVNTKKFYKKSKKKFILNKFNYEQ